VAANAADITDPDSLELVENFQTILDADGLAFYPDWPAPGYYDVLVANVQELINGTKDPSDFLDSIAEPYETNRETIGR